VLGGLHALGYSYQEARESLRQIPQDIEGREKRIKEALKILSTK
jgi:Holliday junction resolvasome RuvABC DNA-binding subunit